MFWSVSIVAVVFLLRNRCPGAFCRMRAIFIDSSGFLYVLILTPVFCANMGV